MATDSRYGQHWRPGVWLDEGGCLFVIHAPALDLQLELRLYDDQEHIQQALPLQLRQGPLQGIYVPEVRPGQLYAYRSVRHGKTLIDPYARLLNRTLEWGSALLGLDSQSSEDSDALVPKSVVRAVEPEARPMNRPIVLPQQRVIYELHVKGFSMLNPEVPADIRGRYAGLAHSASIAYLKSLGITTVQLMPCMSFMSEAHLVARGLSNYWGYNPVNFFAPDWRYALADPIQEFRDMVDALHSAGLEVLLDVVYNHTAESDAQGPAFSFKVLDKAGYYRLTPEGSLENFSGCGNSFRSDSPAGLRLIMDSLRYWYGSMGVDGFRFDLGSSLGRVSRDRQHDFSPDSPFFNAVAQDPVLCQALMLAEPWDLGPNGYQLGNFPPGWLEVNDRFRDGMRAFWRGDEMLPGEVAHLLMGSRRYFDKSSRPAHTSVNNVSYHDGFTLEDLVSYNERHNLANGEQNRDGHGHNLSENHGAEGPSTDEAVLQARHLHKLNLLLSLLFARGTPHLLGGDERGRTQLGNNNAYCQDNEISWLDWRKGSDLVPVVQALLGIRQQLGSLGSIVLPDENWFGESNVCGVEWRTDHGAPMNASEWEEPGCRSFSLLLERAPTDASASRERWAVLLNGSTRTTAFKLPSMSPTHSWRPMLSHVHTAITEAACTLPPTSIQVLRAISQVLPA
ncbi:glycogen debranching protein GlgX [Allohahella marinimesophila]|uniref:Glycogen debranching protein GlgX n=1 Tax=Allohahella marinimesophila TaxID=1054972 RepID=A0ABP7Q9U9_9GAMM